MSRIHWPSVLRYPFAYRLATAAAIAVVGTCGSWCLATRLPNVRHEVARADSTSAANTTIDVRPAAAAERDASLSTKAQGAPAIRDTQVVPCEACSPVLMGVECDTCCVPGTEPGWQNARPIPWQVFMQGEYIGPHRLAHVPDYRLRVADVLELVFRKTVEPTTDAYQLNVGDQIRIQSYIDTNLDTVVTIQPDGMITLRLLHQVRAAGRTIDELERSLEDHYKEYYKQPAITVTPVQLESKLNELRASVDSRYGFGGQTRRAVVSPDGTIQLPALGSIPAQGMTTDELKREINERYGAIVTGMEVTPVLVQIAPRHVYVLGEVERPGRYEMSGPTTVMQALSLAGGWQIGGNLRHIVIFRRTDDWKLIATRIDIRGALYGKSPCPADDLWVRDSDIVVIPKHPVQVADDWANLIFSEGIYRVFPIQSFSFTLEN